MQAPERWEPAGTDTDTYTTHSTDASSSAKPFGSLQSIIWSSRPEPGRSGLAWLGEAPYPPAHDGSLRCPALRHRPPPCTTARRRTDVVRALLPSLAGSIRRRHGRTGAPGPSGKRERLERRTQGISSANQGARGTLDYPRFYYIIFFHQIINNLSFIFSSLAAVPLNTL